MTGQKHHFQSSAWHRVMVVISTLALLFGNLALQAAPAVQAQPAAAPQAAPLLAPTNVISLNVVSARDEPKAFGGAGVLKGDPVSTFKYIINVDNTGETTQRSPADGCSPSDPGYPGTCRWTSIAGSPGWSPIYTQGDQSDFTAGGLTLPDGRYIVSVMADGYKLDGAHFTVPMEEPGVVTVELQPTPLPTATLRAFVFEDNAITNGAPDAPVEQGLAGFVGHLFDYIDEVTTDVYGNPLCTQYETDVNGQIILDPPDYMPNPIPGTGGHCVSDANGELVIPNMGTNRYALSAVPPDGSNWIQTTTLEGNHDWDTWVMEGTTGYDTEFVVAGEPFPTAIFGFVRPTSFSRPGTGTISGVVMGTKVYVPAAGGLALPGTIWGGLNGAKLDHPIDRPWISLSDLNNGDVSVYVGQGNPDGTFSIPNVPAGNYTLTYWDEPQNYILDMINVTVAEGEAVDMGVLPLTGWWTRIDGYVFNDLNSNGVRDPGEPGMANFPVTMKKRENSVMDRGAVAVTTDQTGYYVMENVYPMTQWLVSEVYADLYYTTGVTYQADNQPEPTTVLGAGVDVSILPIIGLGGRLDWGVHAYPPNKNGGIVGTVSYDTTRNEFDPRYAAVESWQPGIPDLDVRLFLPVDCGTTNAPCDPTGRYELAPDGSYAEGQLLNDYLTETWARPTGCVARDMDGNPLTYPDSQQVLPTDPNAECLEGPLMGVQFQTGFSTVNGNYGFADGCFGVGGYIPGDVPGTGSCADGSDPTPLTPGDYLVKVVIPDDATGRPMYQVTKEEDINIYNGDQFIPQIPPPECAGPLHTVDVAGVGTDNYPATTYLGVTVPASTPVDNAPFADAGGTPFEGSVKPECDMKLVHVSNGRSIAPTFNLFTDVPVPGRLWGYLVDDLNFSANPQSLLYGEKAGIPFAPIGIYDYTNRLVTTIESDYNGLFDVLLPSTNRISCPTPSGVCANLYRLVGNDPGIPGRLNPNYRPEFRTISADFEVFPGLIVPADLAPTQVGVTVQLPGGQFTQVSCNLDASTPQLFAVSQPYADTDAGATPVTIRGMGFGAAQGTGAVTLDGLALPVAAWSDRQIDVSVPASTPLGQHQLNVRADNGQSLINGLTFYVLGSPTPFPASGVLDTFNRANGALGANWAGDTAQGTYRIFGNEVQVRNAGNVWYVPSASYGANQEAFFTFTKISATSNGQGLILKFNGTSPTSNNASLIDVLYDPAPVGTVTVRTKVSGGNLVTRASFAATFAAGDRLGARALADGSVNVYKNGALLGSVNVTTGANPWPASLAAQGGRIGVRFLAPGLGTTGNDARFDNFGGGTVSVVAGYRPDIYEVGPGKPSATIQAALDSAAVDPTRQSLVVVYPGQPDLVNPRANPRGAYYENLIISAPVKLQGVGPGGVYPDGSVVPGSIIDGGAFGGDTALADAWRAKIASLTWDGNQNVYEGAAIYILATDGQFGAPYKASIDGFDLRGGDQQGFPNNINEIGGGPTGLPPNATTQGGAIFANAYARYLQITNNVVQNNGGAYGTIRIGSPDLPAPNTSNHNENLRIANNRIIANGGTNLAGAIGIFAGADNYEVAYNDICGNFSAEYGGGLSVYGFSPNGSIHHNRIYFNRSYDEGGGIMIAGQLPADPGLLSPGSGAVNIYNNLIQANLANDDGGGLRFLMAGNYPMNVYNNMIVNNLSTHEGGGVALNDSPDVRIFNNTIMKNTTTATAVTSNGLPAPAGLSTSANSSMLQATLPAGAPLFSNPLLFNNIFWDNRAGTRGGATVVGIGIAGDATPINYWDMGVADNTGLLSPTNSILQVTTGTVASATNQVGVDPTVVAPYDTSVTFAPWRTNPNFIGAIMVAADLPPNLMGDYHIPGSSAAVSLGAASKTNGAVTVNAPSTDYDGDGRPADGGYEAGADEIAGVVVSFPRTALIDNFNRADGALGSGWAGNTGQTYFRILANQVQVRQSGGVYRTTSYGANQEAFFTFTKLVPDAAEQGLFLKFTGSSLTAANAAMIEVVYNAAVNTVTVWTDAPTQNWVNRGVISASFANGDTLGARALSDGTVSVFKNGVEIGSVNVASGANPWPTANVQGGGRIGVVFLRSGEFVVPNDARFDDFGGGTMP